MGITCSGSLTFADSLPRTARCRPLSFFTVILAHPDTGSFNHAVAETAVGELRRAGHAVKFHDLYEEGFDPVLLAGEIPAGASLPLPIAAHCREITAARNEEVDTE